MTGAHCPRTAILLSQLRLLRSHPRHSILFCDTPGAQTFAHSPRTCCTTFQDSIPGSIISTSASPSFPSTFIWKSKSPVKRAIL